MPATRCKLALLLMPLCSLSSGVYIAKMRAGTFTAVRKLVLMR
jgi:hypothetical protein